jgi:hypothetical protein
MHAPIASGVPLRGGGGMTEKTIPPVVPRSEPLGVGPGETPDRGGTNPRLSEERRARFSRGG